MISKRRTFLTIFFSGVWFTFALVDMALYYNQSSNFTFWIIIIELIIAFGLGMFANNEYWSENKNG